MLEAWAQSSGGHVGRAPSGVSMQSGAHGKI